jgi:3-deoxy-D-manno-octulosonic-acid transferase
LKERATVIYLPVDLSWVAKKAISAINPSVFLVVETELWPNLITALHKRGIPILLVNGRISPRSYKGYMKIRPIFKGMLEKITLFCMQNEEYAQRIKDMGAPTNRVIVTGSVKFDTAAKTYAQGNTDSEKIRRDLGLKEGEKLLIAGSTHRPEEGIVLEIYKDLLKTSPGLRLLIAPRHIERVQEIEALTENAGFGSTRVSGVDRMANTKWDKAPVIILDTIGRLSQIFSIGTVIFIGGSLMRRGGQNILEPAIFSKAILFGPHMFNFKDIADQFIKEGAARMVKDKGELFHNISNLLQDVSTRQLMGQRARAIMDKNMGATARTMVYVNKIFNSAERAQVGL